MGKRLILWNEKWSDGRNGWNQDPQEDSYVAKVLEASVYINISAGNWKLSRNYPSKTESLVLATALWDGFYFPRKIIKPCRVNSYSSSQIQSGVDKGWVLRTLEAQGWAGSLYHTTPLTRPHFFISSSHLSGWEYLARKEGRTRLTCGDLITKQPDSPKQHPSNHLRVPEHSLFPGQVRVFK